MRGLFHREKPQINNIVLETKYLVELMNPIIFIHVSRQEEKCLTNQVEAQIILGLGKDSVSA